MEFDIHRIDAASGEDREVLRGRRGLSVESWRPDGAALLLAETRGDDAQDIYQLDLAKDALESLFVPEQRAAYGSIAWTPDGRGFTW